MSTPLGVLRWRCSAIHRSLPAQRSRPRAFLNDSQRPHHAFLEQRWRLMPAVITRLSGLPKASIMVPVGAGLRSVFKVTGQIPGSLQLVSRLTRGDQQLIRGGFEGPRDANQH